MGIDINQKKLTIAIILGALAICAFLLARGLTSIAAARLFPLDLEGARGARKKDGSGTELPGSRAPDITEILKRNIFDSLTGPLWPPPEPEETAEPIEPPEEDFVADPNAPPPLCEGPLKLMASVYSDRLPEWSFAAIGTGSGQPLLYREGGEADGNQVLAIFPNAVFIKPSSGRPCSLAMFAQNPSSKAEKPKAAPRTARTAPVTSATGDFSKQDLEKNIKRVSSTEFTITRDLMDRALQNQAALMRSARIVPHEVDGKVVGVKLYGIRRNSLLGQLGLQNGDLMRTINGYDMTSPDRALEAYSRLRSTDSLTLALQRRGSNLNVNYSIR